MWDAATLDGVVREGPSEWDISAESFAAEGATGSFWSETLAAVTSLILKLSSFHSSFFLVHPKPGQLAACPDQEPLLSSPASGLVRRTYVQVPWEGFVGQACRRHLSAPTKAHCVEAKAIQPC